MGLLLSKVSSDPSYEKYRQYLRIFIIALATANALALMSISTGIYEQCDTDPVRSLVTTLLCFNWAILAFTIGISGCIDYTETTPCLSGSKFDINQVKLMALVIIAILLLVFNTIFPISILVEYNKKDGKTFQDNTELCITDESIAYQLYAILGLNGALTMSILASTLFYAKVDG